MSISTDDRAEARLESANTNRKLALANQLSGPFFEDSVGMILCVMEHSIISGTL